MNKLWLPLLILGALLALWGTQQTWDPKMTVTLTSCTAPTSTPGFYDAFTTPQGAPYQIPDGKTGYITALFGHQSTHGAAHSRVQIGYGQAGVCNSETPPAGDTVLVAFVEHSYAESTEPVSFTIGPIPAGSWPYVLVDNEPSIWNAELVLR